MKKVPLTAIEPPAPLDAEYLDALERWGELPDKLPIPDAVRYIAHLTRQNPAAIERVVVKAVVSGGLRYWGQSGEPGVGWREGMFRVLHRFAEKPRVRLGADGPATISAVIEQGGTLHLEAMAVDPRDVVRLLIARGRKVPDELRHLLESGADSREPEKGSAEQRLAYWLRAELWALYEAAYLLAGATPRGEGAFLKQDRDAGGPVGLTYRALKDATLAASLPFIEVDGVLARRRIKPADAVAWAVRRAMPIPEVLRQVLQADPPGAEQTVQREAGLEGGDRHASVYEDESREWRERARARASAWWLDCDPSTTPNRSLAAEFVARWCRDHGVKGNAGTYPSAAYLRKHVLDPRHWEPPRR